MGAVRVFAGHEAEPNGNRPAQRDAVKIDEDEMKKHPLKQELLQRSFHPDGGVAGW